MICFGFELHSEVPRSVVNHMMSNALMTVGVDNGSIFAVHPIKEGPTVVGVGPCKKRGQLIGAFHVECISTEIEAGQPVLIGTIAELELL